MLRQVHQASSEDKTQNSGQAELWHQDFEELGPQQRIRAAMRWDEFARLFS
jgi:hypothetical protein